MSWTDVASDDPIRAWCCLQKINESEQRCLSTNVVEVAVFPKDKAHRHTQRQFDAEKVQEAFPWIF